MAHRGRRSARRVWRRPHCRIARGAHSFTLVPIETADVFVNGARVERFELVDGVRLALSASQFVFKSTA